MRSMPIYVLYNRRHIILTYDLYKSGLLLRNNDKRGISKNRIISKKDMSKFSNRESSHPDENHLPGQEEVSLKIRVKSKTKLYPRINI